MAANYQTNGNTLVSVDGAELGLTESPINISVNVHHMDIAIQTFGGQTGTPGDVQQMMADAVITMALVYYDPTILLSALTKSIGGGSNGVMPVAGQIMGVSNKFCTLNLTSPAGGLPWTFPTAYLTGTPINYPIGNERTVAIMTWRAIPYAADPRTALGAILFTN